MPKILKDSDYNSLKQKSDNYDTVVNAVVANNESLSADDVTPDVITQALNASAGDDSTELQTQLNAAIQRAETAESRVSVLETENANLRGSAGADPAVVTTKSDPGAAPESIADFADSNAGNTAAILNRLKEDGLL